MNITLVISSLGAGGAERVLSNLANYWDGEGHRVTLITLAADKPFYHLSEKVILNQLDQVSKNGESFLSRLFNIVKRLFSLRNALQKSKPNVIVSFVDVMNITTLIACIGLKIPVIVSERTNPFFYKIPAFYQFLRKIFYPCAKKVIVQTQSAAEYFKKLTNVSVIPNVVKKAGEIHKSVLKPVCTIVSVGRLCPNKGFSTLIKAFAEILKFNSGLKLTIYGEGADRENLEFLIKKLNVGSSVFLPGTVPNVEEILVDADLFVFPSHYEGFPNALCEAMAVGLPVVASNCSGNIDIIQDGMNGRLFPVGDVEKLTSLMKELISDSLQCQRLSQSAMALADTYSHDNVYKLWDAVIQNAVVSTQESLI